MEVYGTIFFFVIYNELNISSNTTGKISVEGVREPSADGDTVV
jgi:hypothetical protein